MYRLGASDRAGRTEENEQAAEPRQTEIVLAGGITMR